MLSPVRRGEVHPRPVSPVGLDGRPPSMMEIRIIRGIANPCYIGTDV
jgi:hypothetical protein